MPNYIRAFQPGGTFFLTLVTENRTPIFSNATTRNLLHASIESCQRFHPFELNAIVLLPDHLHLLITLPYGEADFSKRIANLKGHFTRAYLLAGGMEQSRSPARQHQRMRGVWQRRFWEHTIRDDDDLIRHTDYIHYNPVKHGLSKCAHGWRHSSFHRFVTANHYQMDWCCQCHSECKPPPNQDGIAEHAGE